MMIDTKSMNRYFLKIVLFGVLMFLIVLDSSSQDLGATFCWHYKEIYGGHDYPYNQSIVTNNLPSETSPKWEGMEQWWENMVEEADYAGLDFVALLSRGTQPNQPKDLGTGDPKHIGTLIKYMKERNAKFKLAIFDDCPNSWQSSRNYNLYGKDNSKYELFDCGNPDNYKYIWDYNLKIAFEKIPDEMRYKIDNRPVIFFWSVKSTWMTNMDGNLSKIVSYIKEQCEKTFGFTPYLIVQKPWFDRDKSLTATSVDAAHNWFSAAGGTSYTLNTLNNVKVGVCVPSFVKPAEPENGVLLPGMDTTDQSTRLKLGLDNTVKAGARVTLAEGFTDAAEGAALWRSGDKLYYNYPNQRLNILRRYTKNPYPDTLRVEFETCDGHFDLTTGNSGQEFLKEGNLDVVKCADKYIGWHVTNTQPGEWMEWKELPLTARTKFQLRYKSSSSAAVKFTVGNFDLPTINLASTNNVWTTIDAGEYSAAINSLHDVRFTIVSGTPDINYFSRIVNNISTGIVDKHSVIKQFISLYPNPYTSGIVRIQSTGFENLSNVILKITNLTGQIVYQQKLNESTAELNLSGTLKEAIYIVSIESGTHKAVTKLIIHQTGR